MDLAKYTPDAICKSMGLSGFIEPDWSPPTLRVLLKPSFDAEVCITLATSSQGVHLSVIALSEMLWRQIAPVYLPTSRGQTAMPGSFLSQAIAEFGAALAADQESEGSMVCLDGMLVDCCLLTETGLERFACHPYRPAISNFIQTVLREASQSCSTAPVRNALAACGRYVGLALPSEPKSPAGNVVRIAVLGTPDSRADLLWQLSDGSIEPDARLGIDGG